MDASDTNDTELLNFNSHALTFALINAVKELDAKNQEQQNQIENLTAQNAEQQREIEALKSIVCQDHPGAEMCGR